MSNRSQYIGASIQVKNGKQGLFEVQDFLLKAFPNGLDNKALGVLAVFCSDVYEKNELLFELLGSKTWSNSELNDQSTDYLYEGILISYTKGVYPLLLIELQTEKYEPELLCLMVSDTILLTMFLVELDGFDTKSLVDMITRIYSNREGKMIPSIPKHLIFLLDRIPNFQFLQEVIGDFQKRLAKSWKDLHHNENMEFYILFEFIALSPKPEKISNLRKRLLFPESDQYIFSEDPENFIFTLPSLFEECQKAIERGDEFLDLEEKRRNAFGNQLNFFEEMLTGPHFERFSNLRKSVLNNQQIDLRNEGGKLFGSLETKFLPYISYSPKDCKEIFENRLKFLDQSISQEIKELSDLQKSTLTKSTKENFEKSLTKCKNLSEVNEQKRLALERFHKAMLLTCDQNLVFTLSSFEEKINDTSLSFVQKTIDSLLEKNKKLLQDSVVKCVRNAVENPGKDFWNKIGEETKKHENEFRSKMVSLEREWMHTSTQNPNLIVETSINSELEKSRNKILPSLKKKWLESSNAIFSLTLKEKFDSRIHEETKKKLLEKENEIQQILFNMKTSKNNFSWISNEEFQVIKRDLNATSQFDISNIREKVLALKKGKKIKSLVINGLWFLLFILSFFLEEGAETFFTLRKIIWGLIGLASMFSNGVMTSKNDLKKVLKLFKLVAEE